MIDSTRLRRLLALACMLVPLIVQAQVTTIGYQNVARPEAPGTLLSHPSDNDSLNTGRTTTVQYLRGWIIVGAEAPGSTGGSDLEMRVYDIADPANPIRRFPSDFGLTASNDSWYSGNFGYNAHGSIIAGNGLGPTTVRAADFGGLIETVNANLSGSTNYGLGLGGEFPISGPGGRSQVAGWGATFTWYGGTASSAKIWKRAPNGNGFTNREMAEFDHFGQFGGGDWHPIFFGDLLIYARSSSSDQNGVVVYRLQYDLDDPQNQSVTPQLVGVLDGRFQGYWPNLFSDGTGLYVVGSGSSNVQVVDLTEAAEPGGSDELTKVRELTFPNLNNATYPRYQDQYAFIDHVKFDMTRMIAGDPNPEVLVLDKFTADVNTSQMSLPLGNLWLTGGIAAQGIKQGMAVWVQQQAPDTTPPSVAYHIPQAGQTNYPRHAPLSFMLHEAMRDTFLNERDFTVRKVLPDDSLDAPVAGYLQHEFSGTLHFIPHDPLEADTTYQVDFLSDPANEAGFVDAAGNYIEPYTFRFSTGGALDGNVPPVVTAVSADDHRPEVGQTITVTLDATDADAGDQAALEYRFNFDGTWSAWSANNSATGSFAEEGRYLVRAQVRDPFGHTVLGSTSILVLTPIAGPLPTHNNTLAIGDDSAGRRLWTVNPDSNTVSIVDPATGDKVIEYPVGAHPRNIARDANGRYWVTCMDDDEVWILNENGAIQEILDVGYGSGPFGVAPSPDGQTMFVSFYQSGHVSRIPVDDTAAAETIATVPTPRAIAVSPDGTRIFVTRFISPFGEGEVQELESNGATFRVKRTIKLRGSMEDDGGDRGSGTPNYLAGIAISPDGAHAVVTSKQDNVQRGVIYGVEDLDPDNSVRAILSVIDLSTNTEISNARRDFDNSEGPYGVDFSPDGSLCFVTLQGKNELVAIDSLELGTDVNTTAQIEVDATTGLAPQGVLVDPVSNRILVQNLMDRSVSVFDAAPFFTQNLTTLPLLQETDTVAVELLAPEVLRGKQIFYNAADPRMSGESYISCATCHIDGGTDGRVWDFTGRGEGLRRTPSLRGRGGMSHGNVHWSANFDEIHDFEHDMRGPFGGEGFLELTPTEFAAQHPGPASVKSALNSDLDALAAYVASLTTESLPRSPYRNLDGSMTQAALDGKAVVETLNCVTCHTGPELTDSTVQLVNAVTLHDVGTVTGMSGRRLGGDPLPGVDTPTLLGLYENRGFLHHGQVETLEEVFSYAGGVQIEAEEAELLGGVSLENSNGVGGSGTRRGMFGGSAVRLDSSSEIVRFTGIDGGAGGPALIGFRYAMQYGNGDGSVTVNGVEFTPALLQQPAALAGWHVSGWRWAFLEVDLNAGTDNTIEFRYPGGRRYILDAITVANEAVLTRANPHRQLLALSQTDRDNVLAWLLQLDGRDPDGSLPAPPDNRFFQETGGLVVIEAEAFTGSDPRSDALGPWLTRTETLAEEVGDYVQSAAANTTFSWADNAELSYRIDFVTPGDYDLWIRRYYTSGSDNSLFWGLNDVQQSGVDNGGNHNAWVWTKVGTVNIEVGRHTLQLRRRESNARIDRLLLTTNGTLDPGSVAAGEGPGESLEGSTGTDTFLVWSGGILWPGGADATATGNPDFDSNINLAEYGMDLDPLGGDTDQAPSLRMIEENGTNWMILTYRRNSNASDLRVVVEQSGDMRNWQTVPFDGLNASQRVVDPDPDGDGSAEMIEVRMRIDGQREGFWRVRVDLID